MSAPFWSNLDKYVGGVSIKSLEKAAGVGDGTLRKQREAGNPPSLEIAIKLSRHLDVPVASLLGTDTPPEMAVDPTTMRVPFCFLTASHLNPRRAIDPEALAELADSIAAKGLLQNLVVRQDADQPALMWVVAGERRFRALEILARDGRMPFDIAEHGVPCRVVDADDAEHTMLALLENMQRQDVNPMDEAEAIARLHDADPVNWGTRRIAEGLGVTQRHVQMRMALAHKLSPEAKADLRSGKITLAHARILVTQSAEQQLELIAPMPGGRKQSAEEMARDITQDAFPLEYALFNVAESGLQVVEVDDLHYILDFERAMELQMAAVQAHGDALLRDGAAFVDFVEGWWMPGNYSDGGTGVVIQTDDDGEVTIHTGLRLKQVAGSTAPVQDGKMWKAQNRYNVAHREAADALIAAIGRTLHVETAIDLLLWNAIVGWDESLLRQHATTPSDGPLAELAAEIGDTEKKPGAAWIKLEAAPNRKKALVQHVLTRLKVPAPGQALSPILEELSPADFTIPSILFDGPKQRNERCAEWANEDPRQTDIEDALTDAEAEEAMADVA